MLPHAALVHREVHRRKFSEVGGDGNLAVAHPSTRRAISGAGNVVAIGVAPRRVAARAVARLGGEEGRALQSEILSTSTTTLELLLDGRGGWMVSSQVRLK